MSDKTDHTLLALIRLREDRYISRNFGHQLFEIEREIDFQRREVRRLKVMAAAWEKAFDLQQAQEPKKEPDHG